jgi:hypothetical protein
VERGNRGDEVRRGVVALGVAVGREVRLTAVVEGGAAVVVVTGGGGGGGAGCCGVGLGVGVDARLTLVATTTARSGSGSTVGSVVGGTTEVASGTDA